MIRIVDTFLKRYSMYRLMLYSLLILVATATIFSFFNLLPFAAPALLFSAGFLVVVSVVSNMLFAKIFKVKSVFESAYISALILSLIITPAHNQSGFIFLFLAAFLAAASKYLLALRARHIFNPAAVSVVITALFLNQAASWWVGTAVMLPAVLVCGLLVVRKIRKEDLVLGFVLVALLAIWVGAFLRGSDLVDISRRTLLDSPLAFFALVMLTEPRTTPAARNWRVLYGGLVGLLFSPYLRIGTLVTTPEIALVAGNAFSYLVSPRGRQALGLMKTPKSG